MDVYSDEICEKNEYEKILKEFAVVSEISTICSQSPCAKYLFILQNKLLPKKFPYHEKCLLSKCALAPVVIHEHIYNKLSS